jgi:hypothetical protein
MKLLACSVALIVAWMAWSGGSVSYASDGRDITAVNSSVNANEGQTYGTLSTVNGDVRVSRRAVANVAKTVNGSITLESEARVGEASTVNGSLDLAEGVSIEREARTVNGHVDMRKRSRVGGDVATVSGDIGQLHRVLDTCERQVALDPELTLLSARRRVVGEHDEPDVTVR